MGETIQVDRAHPRAPIKLTVDRDGGITGLTVAARIATGVAGEFLDFNDLTFKSAGHVTPTLAVPEVDAGDMPGLYAVDGGFDIATITNLPAAQLELFVHFDITAGGETGNDVDTWQFVDRHVDLTWDELNTGGDHNIKDSTGKQQRQASTGGLDIEAQDVVSATASTVELQATESAIDDFLARRYIAIVDGLGAGQVRVIDSYVGATKIATLSRAWDTTPDATSDYILLLSTEATLTEPERATLVDLTWDEVLTGATHNVVNSAGRRLRQLSEALVVLDDSVVDATPAASNFDTGIVAVDDFHNDAVLVFISGALTGQSKPITTFTAAGGNVAFDEPFTSAPANGDTFIILVGHVHPLSQIAAAVDAALSLAHGATSWLSGLTATQDERLRRVWKMLGNDPANAVTHTKATTATDGAITSADSEVDVVVSKPDANTTVLTQQ
jgi:hypothetical protein